MKLHLLLTSLLVLGSYACSEDSQDKKNKHKSGQADANNGDTSFESAALSDNDGSHQRVDRLEMIFAKVDSNSDQCINQDELGFFMSHLKRRMHGRFGHGQRHEKPGGHPGDFHKKNQHDGFGFDRLLCLDTDGDSKISREEFEVKEKPEACKKRSDWVK